MKQGTGPVQKHIFLIFPLQILFSPSFFLSLSETPFMLGGPGQGLKSAIAWQLSKLKMNDPAEILPPLPIR